MTHVDLFAGIGGFSLAAKNLGIDTLAFSEIDAEAIKAYKLNFPDHSELGDITKLSAVGADILTAGVPCQAWSIAGKRKGFDDPRGKLWEDTIRVVRASQPKAFICENVKGMTHKKHLPALNFILEQFKEAGYDCKYTILNSKYFDVPQNRERIFIVGFRQDLNINYDFPVGSLTQKTIQDILEPNVDASNFLTEKAILYMNKNFGKVNRWNKGYHSNSDDVSRCLTADYHKGVPYNVFIDYDIDSYNLPQCLVERRSEEGKLERAKYRKEHGKDYNGFRLKEVTLRKDGIANCITATKAPIDSKIMVREAIVRRFTTRECARLQGYPDDFKLHPVQTHAYKQLGNSVTVPVVQAIMKSVQERL